MTEKKLLLAGFCGLSSVSFSLRALSSILIVFFLLKKDNDTNYTHNNKNVNNRFLSGNCFCSVFLVIEKFKLLIETKIDSIKSQLIGNLVDCLLQTIINGEKM